MRRFPTTLVVVILALLAAVGGWKLFYASESQRYQAVQAVRNQRSELHFSETVTHAKGPIAREEWQLDNVNGTSTATYRAENRAGSRIAKFTEPIQGYDVTFAFEKLVQDGVWELKTRPLKGKTDDVYTISVAQTAGNRSGKHRFTFADPHYLATTAGRQYNIHLDKNKPVPDLLTLQSTSTADPRYQKVVDDFASFGPPRFKKTVAAAREKLLKS
jgi:type II secretory pathway pseudopilin PulG